MGKAVIIDYKIQEGEIFDIQGMCFESNGSLKTVGYKTLRSFCTMIKKQNEFCKKRGVKLSFTITLPIKS